MPIRIFKKRLEGTLGTFIGTPIVFQYSIIWWGSVFVKLIDDYRYVAFLRFL